jgi:hypothetical protein
MQGSTTFIDIQNIEHFPFSSVSPATSDGVNQLVSFLSEGRSNKGHPDAQIGRTSFVKAEDVSFIRELQVRILGLVRGNMSYVNEELLPTIVTRDHKFKWKTIQFIPGRMVRNPAFGVNETNERIETSEEVAIGRRGQHYIIDEETFYTEQGQKDFQLEMQYWAVALADTMALEAWSALVEPRPETRRSYVTKMQNQYTYNQAILKQRDDMFAPYKDHNGIYRMVQESCQYVQRVSGHPVTIMVMPAEKSGLITNGTSMASYKKGGNRGVDLIMSRGDLPEIVPGVKVAAPPEFAVDPSATMGSPIDSNITIGDYCMLKFDRNTTNRSSSYPCMTQLYSDIHDTWNMMPNLDKCLMHSGRFVPNGNSQYKIADWPAGVAYDNNDPFYTLDSGKVVPKITTPKSMLEWAEWCINTKCRFAVVSPFKRYRTQGALFAAAGMHAGFTAVSKPLVTKGEDALAQTLKFNMTAWVGPVVTNPKCFLFTPSVFCNGILGGSGTNLISAKTAERLKNETNWEDNDIHRESLYFLVVGPNGEFDANYIDLRGNARFGNKETYPCSAFYSAHYGWDQIDDGTTDVVSQPIAPICFRRSHSKWDDDAKKWVYVAGNGQFGPLEGVGTRVVREYGTHVPEHIITETAGN